MATYNYITDQGLVVADEAAIVADTEQDFRDIFGSGAVVDADTPNGQLVGSESNHRINVAQNNATVANQINPNFASGVWLDALWALLGGARTPATFSTVTAEITGVAGTVVPANSVAATTNGDRFLLTAEVTLVAGNNTANFQAETAGAIDVPAGSLTTVVSNVLGWETVNNAAAGAAGQAIESEEASRVRRRQTIGANARTVPAAAIAKVLDVAGVLSIAYRDNPNNSPTVIDGINLPANSIYACVEGGTDLDVATALLASKGGGTPWAGTDVSQAVVEPASGQSYTVGFDRPDDQVISIRVTASVPQGFNDPVGVITASVRSYADDTFRLDVDVLPFEISGAINEDHPTLNIRLVEVGFGANFVSLDTQPLDIAINERATVANADIGVVIL